MRSSLLLFAFLLATGSNYAQNGIGLRLGDPSGITFKKYSDDRALEFSIGRTRLISGKGYYSDNFFKWYADATFNYADYSYLGTNRSTPIGMHVHYLIHTDWFSEDFDGLQWYYGFGGQFRMQHFTHEYKYKINGDPNWYYAEGAKITDIDLGGDAVIGAEYEFQEVPIRVFVDLVLFMEVVDNPFYFWFQGGIGGRYMF